MVSLLLGYCFTPLGYVYPPPSLISQVAIYIHTQIFQRYHFTVDSKIFGHPNIFAMFCYDPSSATTMAYINVYANPNRDCPSALKNTIPTLLLQLYKLSNLRLIQGDFNLHCPYWDESSADNPPLAWELIRCFHDKQLSLINDESIPTSTVLTIDLKYWTSFGCMTMYRIGMARKFFMIFKAPM